MSDVARILKEARDQGRLTALDFAKEIFDDFIELHGDRNFRDDGAVIGGIGRLNGQAVTVVGIQKGKTYKIISIVTLVNLIRRAIVRLFAL
jgi:Acetyl co-enzyme A carboxylase carboxyltransferase alpha subunit